MATVNNNTGARVSFHKMNPNSEEIGQNLSGPFAETEGYLTSDRYGEDIADHKLSLVFKSMEHKLKAGYSAMMVSGMFNDFNTLGKLIA